MQSLEDAIRRGIYNAQSASFDQDLENAMIVEIAASVNAWLGDQANEAEKLRQAVDK